MTKAVLVRLPAPTTVTVPAGIAPPSAKVRPSVFANFARWFAVDDPGPTAQVEQLIVPVVVTGPPLIGEDVSTSVTVPEPLPPPPRLPTVPFEIER